MRVRTTVTSMPWPGWRDEAIPTMRRTGEHRQHGEASTRPGVPGVTPGERALRRRLQRRALEQSPILARRELAFYDFIRRLLTERELVDAIELGFIEPMIARLLSDEALEPGLLSFRVAMNETLISSATMAAADLPRVFRPAAFDVLNPLILDAARDRNAIAIGRIKAGVCETVRQAGIDALRAGQNPRTAARQIRSVIGLAPNQEGAIRNFRSMLVAGDRQALTRTLRDKRFDPTLRKALGARGTGLSSSQVNQMTDAYRRRMIAHNADTQARSIALEAQKRGQRLSWLDAVQRGVIPRAALYRRWLGVNDSRRRQSHEDMEGEEAHVDQSYSNGQTIRSYDSWKS